MGYSPKHRAVAEAADAKCSEVFEETGTYSHYGLPIFTAPGRQEWVVGTDDEIDEAVKQYITDSVWAFKAEFLAEYTDLPEVVFTSLQNKQYEDANDPILKLIERTDGGIEGFIDEAVEADGRSHFLNSYDDYLHDVVIHTGGYSTTFYVARIQ